MPERQKEEITRPCITVGGHKLDHLAINSTTAVAAEANLNPALPATAAVEFMAKLLNLYSERNLSVCIP